MGIMTLDAALSYVRQGLYPIPIPYRTKIPTITGWDKLRLTEATAPQYFNGQPVNLGILLGPSGLVDVDVDALDALPLARRLLPPTRTFGRASKQRSHFVYRVEAAGATKQFKCPEKDDMIVEYRAKGGQTIFPPSMHLSGEHIAWDTDSDSFSTVDAAELRRAVGRVAAAVLLVRAGLSEDDAIGIVRSPEPPLAARLSGRALSVASRWIGCNVAPKDSTQRTSGTNVVERARAYLARLDPAVSKQGGHPQTLWAAIVLVRGFLLSDSDALSLLLDWNTRCQPPWERHDLEYKISEAHKADRLEHADGWLLDEKKEKPAKSKPKRSGWQKGFVTTEKNEIKPNLANAALVLEHDPRWTNVLANNDFAAKVLAVRPSPADEGVLTCPRSWTDADDIRTTIWLQREFDTSGNGFGSTAIRSAVQSAANRNRFHPVRDYLNALTWDGNPRTESWISDYMGALPSAYSFAVAQRWLVSAVARVFEPGCKADAMLVLEGPQGLGKSMVLRILGDPWFVDEVPDLTSKDSAIQLCGRWVVEWAELSAMTKGEIEKVKAFITRQVDVYRAPYGVRAEEHAPQCVFAGTTNAGTYLRDETGARRFWPVAVTAPFKIDELRRDRDQLWAEAVHLYRLGQPWWLDTPALQSAAAEEADGRYQQDAWEPMVERYLKSGSVSQRGVEIGEVLRDVIGIDQDKWTRGQQMQVASILAHLKWERKRLSRDGARPWIYLPSKEWLP
jgi:predicted P-loop ATPase